MRAGTSKPDSLEGTDGKDKLEGRGGKDLLSGKAGDDDLAGGQEDDDLDGGGGFDTAFFSGSVLDYTIVRRGEGSASVADKKQGRDGADAVRGVEQLAFHDRTVYLQAGVNNAPIGRPDAFTVRYNQELRIPARRLVANDIDFDGDALTITKVKRVVLNKGIVIYRPPTEIQWALAEGNRIQHSFTYEASDGKGGFTTQVAMVTILGPGASGSPDPEAGNPSGPPVKTTPQEGGGGSTTLPTSGQQAQTTAVTPTETLAVTADTSSTIFSASATPETLTDPDSAAVQLGVKFRASVAGTISGIRFYKGPQNTGSHVGSLWTATGQRLATVTFTNETASGWQQATFSSPVSIAAGTTYIASYHAPVGKYSVNENYFTTAVTNGPLEAPASGTSGGNGVYAYGPSTAFPTNTFNASNYWVDVVFQPTATGPNASPIANPDTATTNESTPITINVLANDSDPDNDPLTVTSLDLTGTQGAVTVNTNNTISYDPSAFRALAAGQSATDTFRYNVSDGRGGTAAAAVTVTVNGQDNAFNKISLENARPGNPQSEWGINGNGDPSIEGFATDMSVNVGGTVKFKINTAASDYRLDIYRFGYYGGLGARKVATVQPSVTGQRQPAPLTDPATGLVDAGNWAESASWTVPADATSGVYFAKLVREDGVAGSNHIYFVVRDDNRRSDLVFQTADTTWQAYNTWGGNSFYTGSPDGRAYKVSYNRPFGSAGHSVNRPVLDAEYPMIRWLEANGYDVSYISGVDTDRAGAELLEHKAFLSVGHDEYWTGRQRANVEAARDAGVNLAFFSGNEIYWKSRWEDSIAGSNQPYRTFVTYKETWANAKIDPSPEWTGTWRDPRFSPPSDGGQPENRVTGTIFTVDSYRLDSIKVPAEDGKMRFWRGTSVATQSPGQTATLTPNVLGYEWDEDLDNGFRPPSAINLSSTTLDVAQYVSNYGNTVGPGTATHELTAYRAPNGGGMVFGAGTTRWSWGLDSNHINESSTADPRMQQATVNLLADMNVQPTTLAPGLQPATASTDAVAPQSSITSPSTGTTVTAGSTITITGTASDSGGVVGGVEVSTDGGASWHPAKGRANWSYTWQPASAGSRTILSRASDDSLNTETPAAGVSINVQESPGPWSIWSASTTPSLIAANDPNPLEMGVKFQASRNGYIRGIRFYKSSQNTGTHTGSLWTATGTRLATATFTNETASGWQQANFANPVAVTANTTYVASYFTPTGFYSADVDYFQSSGVGNGPVRALSSPEAGGNGVYAYGATSRFPTSTYRSANYWVDVVFSDTLVA